MHRQARLTDGYQIWKQDATEHRPEIEQVDGRTDGRGRGGGRNYQRVQDLITETHSTVARERGGGGRKSESRYNDRRKEREQGKSHFFARKVQQLEPPLLAPSQGKHKTVQRISSVCHAAR